MTVVVAINCTDGVVLASDSMITNSMGSLGTAETKGKKIYPIANQLFAFAGDQALAARFRAVLENGMVQQTQHQAIALDYATATTIAMIKHFNATGLVSPFNLAAVIAFEHKGSHFCSFYNNDMQPRLLDDAHYWCAFGSGKQFADPFLSFLTTIFCESQPSVTTAKFIATWAVQHAIDINTGGVNGPIQMYVLGKQPDNSYMVIEQTDQDIDDQVQAIEAAKNALVGWRNDISGDDTADQEELPPPTV